MKPETHIQNKTQKKKSELFYITQYSNNTFILIILYTTCNLIILDYYFQVGVIKMLLEVKLFVNDYNFK